MAWGEPRWSPNGDLKHFRKKTGKMEKCFWYAVGRARDGSPITERAFAKSGPLWKDARDKVEALEKGKGGAILSITEACIKFKEHWAGLVKQEEASPLTWTRYEWGIEKLVAFLEDEDFGNGETKINKLTHQDIFRFKSWLQSRHKNNGVISVLKYICAFYTFCFKSGFIEINPTVNSMEGMEEDKVGCSLTDPQVQHIVQCVFRGTMRRDTPEAREQFKDIVHTALLTGMREQEIATFWIENEVINVIGKGRKYRSIPILPELWPILKKYWSKGTKPVFGSIGWNANRIKQRWGRLIRKARRTMELPKRVRFHDLRHSFASNCINAGCIPKALQEILGHASPVTTDRYTHINDKQKAEQMGKMKPTFLTPTLTVAA